MLLENDNSCGVHWGEKMILIMARGDTGAFWEPQAQCSYTGLENLLLVRYTLAHWLKSPELRKGSAAYDRLKNNNKTLTSTR